MKPGSKGIASGVRVLVAALVATDRLDSLIFFCRLEMYGTCGTGMYAPCTNPGTSVHAPVVHINEWRHKQCGDSDPNPSPTFRERIICVMAHHTLYVNQNCQAWLWLGILVLDTLHKDGLVLPLYQHALPSDLISLSTAPTARQRQ